MTESSITSTSTQGSRRKSASSEEERLLTRDEACEMLRISKTKLYSYINSRELATVEFGSRRLIPLSAIRTLIEQHKTEALA